MKQKNLFLKKKMNILYIIIFNNNNKWFKKVTFNNSFDKVFNNLTIGNYGYDGKNDCKIKQDVITFWITRVINLFGNKNILTNILK